MRETHELEEALHHHFKNPALLVTALTHTSYANEAKHNERLEFLGDSVLSIVVAEYLFTHSSLPEGDLTRMRASLVCEAALFEFAKQISLGDYLRLGRGEERGGGRCRPSILSDAFEAVIAALYLDGGMETARAARAMPWAVPRTPPPKRITRQSCRRSCSRTRRSACAMW